MKIPHKTTFVLAVLWTVYVLAFLIFYLSSNVGAVSRGGEFFGALFFIPLIFLFGTSPSLLVGAVLSLAPALFIFAGVWGEAAVAPGQKKLAKWLRVAMVAAFIIALVQRWAA